MTKDPTERQAAIHAWMLDYQREHRMPPTLRDVATRFGFGSTNAVHDHLVLMEKKGLVRHRKGVARGWVAIAETEQASNG